MLSIKRTKSLRLSAIFWVQKFLNIILTKNLLADQLKALVVFNPLSWTQGLKMKLVWHCIDKDTPMVLKTKFLLQSEFFDVFSAEEN